MEPIYYLEDNVIIDIKTCVLTWSMNTASRTSFGKEAASKYDYCCGNSHFAYQTSFNFDGNQHRLKKIPISSNCGSQNFEKIISIKNIEYFPKKWEKNNKNSIKKNQNTF